MIKNTNSDLVNPPERQATTPATQTTKQDLQINSDDAFEYSLVLTSCGRFELLEQTLASLFAYLDQQPKEFILIEDSGNTAIFELVEKFDFPIRVIVNSSNQGQAKSIDIAYSQVTTPYIFHCEDDWLFTRSGFITESFRLLQHLPDASLVQLRGRSESRRLANLPSREHQGIKYFLTDKKTDKRYFGYSYNPSLRRLADYQRIAPIAEIGGEREVSWLFKKMGFVTAHLEQPAVVHLGDDSHVDDTSAPKYGWKRKQRSFNNFVKRLKWRLTGYPFER